MAAVLHDLLDERGVIVAGCGALHLAPLDDFGAVGGVVEEFGRADVLRVLPDVGGLALVVVPPSACATFGRSAQVIAVGLDPCLRRTRGETVVANDGAAWIFSVHEAENALEVGIARSGRASFCRMYSTTEGWLRKARIMPTILACM